MAKAKLSDEVKTYIVQALACFDSPSVVAAAVKKEFGVDVSHDANKAASGLAPKWKALFGETRKTFLEDTATIAISHRAVRLRGLQRMAEKAEIQGNIVLAASLMKQAADEVATPTPTGVSYGGMGRTCRYPYRRSRSSSSPTMAGAEQGQGAQTIILPQVRRQHSSPRRQTSPSMAARQAAARDGRSSWSRCAISPIPSLEPSSSAGLPCRSETRAVSGMRARSFGHRRIAQGACAAMELPVGGFGIVCSPGA